MYIHKRNDTSFFDVREEEDKMKQLTLTEYGKKKLPETYLVVYAIKNEINLKKGDYIEASAIYTLVGIDKEGYRQLINIYQDRVHNNRYWLDIFESLKAKGLKNILYLSVDNNKNMKRTIKNRISYDYFS